MSSRQSLTATTVVNVLCEACKSLKRVTQSAEELAMIRHSGCVMCAFFRLVGHGREGRFYILASCMSGRRQMYRINIPGTWHRTNERLLYQYGSKSEYSHRSCCLQLFIYM